jgi:tRNA(Ile)-lysidine synthase TilS/MesJ
MIKSAELQWVRHVALFMSGGVDSTILCWRLNQLSIEYGFNFTLLTVENQLNYEQNVRAIIHQTRILNGLTVSTMESDSMALSMALSCVL